MSTSRLKVNELYRSLQGEGLATGLPCTFVRLTGCDLRCRWCDTAYAFEEGSWMTVAEVLARVRQLGDDLVLVTGGEPLLQPAVLELMTRLLDAGTRVLLETGGHRPLAGVDRRVEIIMDLKCPGSGEERRNDWRNLELLKPTDQVKLVIADRRDFDWCRAMIDEHDLTSRCQVIVSPVHGELSSEQLATWILESGLGVRLGLQLHKLIWPPERRGV